MHWCRRCGARSAAARRQSQPDPSGSHAWLLEMDASNFTLPTIAENTSITNSSLTSFDIYLEILATLLNTYYTPLLVSLGCIGNLLSVFIFFTSKLRFQSTSLYLSALAISDTVFLLQLVPPWLTAVQSTVIFHLNGLCQVFVYASFVSCLLSAWLVVAFTIERFVAVMYPLQRNSMCTMTRAKHIVGLLVLAALIFNIPVLRFASPGTNDCNIDSEYVDHAARFNIVDTALSFTLPLAIIIFLNTCIMVGVYRIERVRRALMKMEQEQGSLGTERLPPPSALRSQHRVTRMLLIVSSVFVLLNLPAYTMRVLAYAYGMRATEYTGRWAAVQQLALMFFHTNFGINFILYCLSGQNFRRALCAAIPCLRRFLRRTDDMALVSLHAGRASSISTTHDSANTLSSGSRNAIANMEGPRLHVRRHRSEPVIRRWRFDNSRQLRTPEIIEMEDMRFTASHEHVMERRIDQVTLPLPPPPPPPAARPRTFPFLFFPYRNLMNPRSRNSTLFDDTPRPRNRNNSSDST
ncbi:neuromedin-U receptor 1 [Trichoplusia ni]|uniref:Neuromedin-U receptor 1 n=1 Tax=Trichoplusia ni TaxID=7111 RepID=A0A7E5WNN0_TRINI|nr:neuromedin-U receptor 1 [Trichoplusia ni]